MGISGGLENSTMQPQLQVAYQCCVDLEIPTESFGSQKCRRKESSGAGVGKAAPQLLRMEGVLDFGLMWYR